MNKQDLKSLKRNELSKWFAKNGFPAFRAEQVFNWLYKNGIDYFEDMSNLPADLIDYLKEKAYFERLIKVDTIEAEDGTIKYLWGLSDAEQIESVYLPFADGRNSICISSQLGCQMGCSFCATGKSGFIRNLTTGEIVDQAFQMQKDISKVAYGEPRISNIVFMGMGEPLENLEAVMKAVNIFNDEKGFNIGMRKITISSSGIVPAIRKLADLEAQLVLAISLNAPVNSLRNRLMPINKKYPLDELLSAVRYYINKTNRRVSFEYVLINGINDTIEMAEKTADLLKGYLCHVNLIPLNPVVGFGFQGPGRENMIDFKGILEERGIECTIRQERGSEIQAACGQLRHLNK
ncbi:23S rRNA (adenine(2503)-C(2))-methyltransferase RlmN [Halocella sp. SP3-1]|uniref:23S rRNA (adenine(2503)-C(2))-methyltransferase RlmN n=1 Tax=Halocella sp. SP3-1 TaxID=2382161 RepID=UPI000F764B84|nr:23S rRNA (adenine(2503)-C(2))-methyltransferase RlmN [Halocella sp. SP3-1]AZO95216.1 23S rRNA (adenine(2503)-C(2))-methyltransferase RlmN [Halocella sp. SP3-1]